MTKLKDLQHEVATLLATVTTSVGLVPVIEDRGTDANEIAYTDALKTKGVVIVCSIPTGGKLASQATGTAGAPVILLDVEVSVLVKVNPFANVIANNPTALAADIMALVSSVALTLAGHKTANPNDVYKLSPDPLTLDTYDKGCWAYLLNFVKRCAL